MAAQVYVPLTPYRMRELECGRFAIETRDSRREPWEAVYIDDSALRTFGKLREITRDSLVESTVVCSSCERDLMAPLMRGGKVVCDHCLLIPPAKQQINHLTLLTGFFFGVIFATILCAVSLLLRGVTR